MQKIIYLLFVSLFILDYLAFKVGVVGRVVSWLPEMISILIFIIIILRVGSRVPLLIHPKYVVYFLILSIHVLAGVIDNAVQSGAVFAGIRAYFKFMPFFFLPAIYNFSNVQIRNQIIFVAALAILQTPVALYQRFFQFAHLATGDVVTGTLNSESILSIFLVSCIAINLAWFLKQKISLRTFVIITILLFIPTVINETKGTLFLLPIALFVPVFFFGDREKKFKYVFAITLISVILMVSYFTAYNYFWGDRVDGSIQEAMVQEGEFVEWLYRGTDPADITGEAGEVRRIDSVLLAIHELSSHLTKLFIGLGIGNVAPSFSNRLTGVYTEEYENYHVTMTTFTQLLWEIGILGIIIYLFFYYLIFDDARTLSTQNNITGAIALGWMAVVVIFVLSMGYKNLLRANVIGCLFWYISGYIATKSYEYRLTQYENINNHALKEH